MIDDYSAGYDAIIKEKLKKLCIALEWLLDTSTPTSLPRPPIFERIALLQGIAGWIQVSEFDPHVSGLHSGNPEFKIKKSFKVQCLISFYRQRKCGNIQSVIM